MSKLASAAAHPSALPPSEEELAEWRALSREEQTRRYREALAHPDNGVAVEDEMDDVLTQARARVAGDHA